MCSPRHRAVARPPTPTTATTATTATAGLAGLVSDGWLARALETGAPEEETVPKVKRGGTKPLEGDPDSDKAGVERARRTAAADNYKRLEKALRGYDTELENQVRGPKGLPVAIDAVESLVSENKKNKTGLEASEKKLGKKKAQCEQLSATLLNAYLFMSASGISDAKIMEGASLTKESIASLKKMAAKKAA